MYNLRVGENKSLVFPVMCYGHLTIDYDKEISNRGTVSTTDDITYGIFGHDDSFTVAAIITPYDVNGLGADLLGNSGSGLHAFSPSGIKDSKKTLPSQQRDTYTIGSTAIYSGNSTSSYSNAKTNLQSYNYLSTTGTNERYNHEMMIFYNTNVQLSLLNATPSPDSSTDFIHSNQPSEYKIKFTVVAGGSDTLTSDVIITSDSVYSSIATIASETTIEGYDSNEAEVSYEKIGSLSGLTQLVTTGMVTIGVPQDNSSPIAFTSDPAGVILLNDKIFDSAGTFIGNVIGINTGAPNTIDVDGATPVSVPPTSTLYFNNRPSIINDDGTTPDVRDKFNNGEELYIVESTNATGDNSRFRKIGRVRTTSGGTFQIEWDTNFSIHNSYYDNVNGYETSLPFGGLMNNSTGVQVNGSITSATWVVDSVDATTKLSIGDVIGDGTSSDGALVAVNPTSITLNASASGTNNNFIVKMPALYRKAKKEASYIVNPHLIAASFHKNTGEMAIYYNGVKIINKVHSSAPITSFSFPLEDYYIGAKANFGVITSGLTATSGPYISGNVNAITTSSNPSSVFFVGQSLFNSVGQLVGTIGQLSSTIITFLENIKINLATGDTLYKLDSSSDTDSDGNPNNDTASTRKQFMGELHEFAITSGVWSSFFSPNTLIPPYKKLLLYYRFKEGELNG